jgi:hypothetical protein
LSELVETDLKLTAANGSVIPYIGWVELAFTLSSKNNQVRMPFLGTTETIEYPIIMGCRLFIYYQFNTKKLDYFSDL